jgi:hypothetical protein
MRHLIDVVVANPALFSALAALVLSEVAPFLPTKWNGLAQALVMAFKKKPADKLPLPEGDK